MQQPATSNGTHVVVHLPGCQLSGYLTTDRSIVALTDSPLLIADWRPQIEHPDVGAHAWFEGVTRRTTGDQTTVMLEYQAYESMALSELSQLAERIVAQHALHRLVIVHRLGQVLVGEASLLVGCSAPHRVNVFQALSDVIDSIKRDVPIWKREHAPDGQQAWVHPT